MSRPAFLLAALFAASSCLAEGTAVHARFGADAFNRAVAASASGNAVFSPYSFEIGCVALSDAFDPITKAHFAETIGVLSDFEGVYGPIMARMREASATNRFSVIAAKALCLPDVRMASVPYRRDLQRVFSIEVCPGIPSKGAECWLRSAMDGTMEDFDIPLGTVSRTAYAAYDLVSVRFSWLEPFATNDTRRIRFLREDGTSVEVDAMCDVRRADIWTNRRFSMIRLPLADDAWFFALRPAEGLSLADIRAEFSSERVDDLLSVMKSVTISGISHDPAEIAIPKMEMTSEIDLAGAFEYFRFPLKGFQRIDSTIRPAAVRQRVRFTLDEQGLDPVPLAVKPAESVIRADPGTRSFALTGPFLFFVYHEPTGSIPVAGQFTGM